MRRNGFTLIELLAVIVILGIVLGIAMGSITDIISNTRERVYRINEDMLVSAARNYLYSGYISFPKEIGESITIDLSDLETSGILDEVRDPNDFNTLCEGYVRIKKIGISSYEYTGYIKCGNNYMTDGFNPFFVPGLVLHLDANSIVGLEDGNSIEHWYDMSGNDNHAVQEILSNRPIYKTDILNGRSVVRFDGENHYFEFINSSLSMFRNKSGITMFSVAKYGTSTYRRDILFSTTPAGGATTRFSHGVRDGQYELAGRRLDSDSFKRVSLGTAITGDFIVHTSLLDHNNDYAEVFVNGTSEGIDNFRGSGNISDTDSATIFIGNNPSAAARRLAGDVAEILVFERPLSTIEREQVEEYLYNKWLAEPPVITLLGDSPVEVEIGTTYNDAGATAWSSIDGDISNNIVVSSDVNTNVEGTYLVTYEVSDSAGNKAVPVNRIVNVYDPYTIVIFDSSTDWTVPSSVTMIDVLVVAGGGGGGSSTAFSNAGAGGGGAGGIVYRENYEITPLSIIEIVVGAGGEEGLLGNNVGFNGEDSKFGELVALGGGGGSGGNIGGLSGGSGGGSRGTYGGSGLQPTSLSLGYGNPGGDHGGIPGGAAASGGGGAGEAGESLAGVAGEAGGVGGIGLMFDITGTEIYYGGGGGGGAAQTNDFGLGGLGGGGSGGNSNTSPTSGVDGTGGGGGGGNNDQQGASGGSGIVIIRYIN